MERIGFIDITKEPKLYIIERKAGNFEIKETKQFSCTKDYDISISGLPDDIDEFYVSLPVTALNFRLMELPFSDKGKMLSVLPFELEGIIFNPPSPPFSKGGMGGFVLDGIILGGNEGKSRVLAVYIEKTVLSKIIEKLKAFNIDPRVVTSIELNKAVKDFHPEKLLDSVDMSQGERVKTAIEEIRHSLINLRRGELSYTKDAERTKKSLRWTAILGIAAVVLFLSSITLKIVSARKETTAIQGDMRKIYSEIFPGDKLITAGLYQFKSRMKELKDKEGQLVGISPLSLLLNLSNINKGSVTFDEITIDKERVMLRGEAAVFGDIQQIKDALSNVLNEVNISDSKTSAQGRVLFTITAREKKG